MKRLPSLLAALAALVLAGCTSFEPLQTSLFTDEDGNILSVDYGRSKEDHESKFVAPNGKVMTMKSKLVVRVTLPDGDDFVAWECMNPLLSGTMYRTDNERWMYHANGITCRVFMEAINPRGEKDYIIAYEGVICEGPGKDSL